MGCNLLESFDDWMEDKDSPHRANFDAWLKKQLNIDDDDFADISNVVLINKRINLSPEDSVDYKRPTMFQITRGKGGKSFKLKDLGNRDPYDPEKAAFPHAASSVHAGKKFILPQSEFEKLLKFPAQQPAGGPGF